MSQPFPQVKPISSFEPDTLKSFEPDTTEAPQPIEAPPTLKTNPDVAARYLKTLQNPTYQPWRQQQYKALSATMETKAKEFEAAGNKQQAEAFRKRALDLADEGYQDFNATREKADILKRIASGDTGFIEGGPSVPGANILGHFVKGVSELIPTAPTVSTDLELRNRINNYIQTDPDFAAAMGHTELPSRTPGLGEDILGGAAEIIPSIGTTFRAAGGITSKAFPVIGRMEKVEDGRILTGAENLRRIAHNIVTAVPRGATVFGVESQLRGQEPGGAATRGIGFELGDVLSSSVAESLPPKLRAARFAGPIIRALASGTTFATGSSLGAKMMGEEQPNIAEEFGKGIALSVFHQAADATMNRLKTKPVEEWTPDERRVYNNAKQLRAARTEDEARDLGKPEPPKPAPAPVESFEPDRAGMRVTPKEDIERGISEQMQTAQPLTVEPKSIPVFPKELVDRMNRGEVGKNAAPPEAPLPEPSNFDEILARLKQAEPTGTTASENTGKTFTLEQARNTFEQFKKAAASKAAFRDPSEGYKVQQLREQVDGYLRQFDPQRKESIALTPDQIETKLKEMEAADHPQTASANETAIQRMTEEGKKPEDIATALGMTPESVKATSESISPSSPVSPKAEIGELKKKWDDYSEALKNDPNNMRIKRPFQAKDVSPEEWLAIRLNDTVRQLGEGADADNIAQLLLRQYENEGGKVQKNKVGQYSYDRSKLAELQNRIDVSPKAEGEKKAEIPNVKPVGQETEYSCGIGALETIFKFNGRKIGGNLKEITKEGMNHDDIERVAGKNGFGVTRIGTTIDDVKASVENGKPVLVNYQDYGTNNGKNGHYAVVTGFTESKIKLADPAEGGKEKWMEVKDFEKRWNDADAPKGERDHWAALVEPKASPEIVNKEGKPVQNIMGEAMELNEMVRKLSAPKKPPTPQVPAIEGMTPLGAKTKERGYYFVRMRNKAGKIVGFMDPNGEVTTKRVHAARVEPEHLEKIFNYIREGGYTPSGEWIAYKDVETKTPAPAVSSFEPLDKPAGNEQITPSEEPTNGTPAERKPVLDVAPGVDEGQRAEPTAPTVPQEGTASLPGREEPAGAGSIVEAPEGGSQPAGGKRASSKPSGSTPGRPGEPGGPPSETTPGNVEADQALGDKPARTKPEPKPELAPADRNHRIAPEDEIVPAGDISKIKANLEAISLLKKLEAEKRNPSPDEKKALARYVGWGGLSNIFDESNANMREEWSRRYANPAEIKAYENWEKKFGKYYDELSKSLTTKERAAASASTLNAHYTSRDIIAGMWDLARHLGFTGGPVLEPAGGIGHFIGLMPGDLADKSRIFAVELDDISARILKKLYPEAIVHAKGFEEAPIRNNSIDLAITNVPFAKDGPVDKRYPRLSLHNYFFARALDAVKPGQLIIAISSNSTMDNMASLKAREYLAERADLVGAIRLPNDAFKKNAGTEVTTDIIILRKKDGTAYAKAEPFRNTETVKTDKGEDIAINEYFAKHPEMMLGKMSFEGTMYGPNQSALVSIPGAVLKDQLAEAVKKLPTDIAGEGKGVEDFTNESAVEEVSEATKEGQFVVKGKSIGVVIAVPGGRQVSEAVPQFLDAKHVDRMRSYIGVRDVTKKLIDLQLDENASDEDIEKLRADLNKTYDAHVKKHGPLTGRSSAPILQDDVEYPIAASLEVQGVKVEEKTVTSGPKKGQTVAVNVPIFNKAEIFTKRTIFPRTDPTSAENYEDAVNISLSYRNALDLEYIGSLLSKDAKQVRGMLLAKELAYENPDSGILETPETYLSGFVRKKLKIAEEAAKTNRDYERNVTALKAVVPKDLSLADEATGIGFRLGSTWIPDKVVAAFVKKILQVGAVVKFLPATGKWVVKAQSGQYNSENTDSWSGGGIAGHELVESTLNLKQAQVYRTVRDEKNNETRVKDPEATLAAQAMQEKLNNKFQEFVRGSYLREDVKKEMEDIYNDRYNGLAARSYPTPEWQYYPNMAHNDKLIPRPHQKMVVSRILSESTGVFHSVGTGKTLIQITAAMEMRRLGIAKKPMLVVQNQTTSQIAATAKQLYPTARILVPSEKDRDAANRQKLLSRVATGDWDIVIIPSSFAGLIPDNPERVTQYIEAEIENLRSALSEAKTSSDNKYTVKDIEKAIKKLQQKLKDQADRKKDNVLYFEQLGVDALFIDESHQFKKLGFFTSMDKVKGIDTGRSERAFSMYMKVQFVQERNAGKNVVMLTGTPISNTMAEAWTILRFLRPDLLREMHIETFDEFASTFGQIVADFEQTATGKWKAVQRFNQFANAQEFISLFKSAADVVLAEDVKLPGIPKLKNGKRTEILIERSNQVKRYIDQLQAELEAWEKLPGKEKMMQRHIPLVIYGRAKKAAVDMRLIDPSYLDEPNSKTNHVVTEALRIWKEVADQKGAIVIFSDIFQSPDASDEFLDDDKTIVNEAYGKPRFNLYEDIKKKLIAKGVPANQIAIATDFNSDASKAVLFKKVNEGTIRILLGSTERLGVGVNIQERLAAAFHIDAPARPMDIEQREGRILRQNNSFTEVELVTFGVKQTLDASAFQKLAQKQRMTNQLLRGDITGRKFQDPSADMQVTYASLMAELTGNPLALERFATETKLKHLEALKEQDHRSKSSALSDIRALETAIPNWESELATERKLGAFLLEKVFPTRKVTSVVIDGKRYQGEDISKALTNLFESEFAEAWKAIEKSVKAGKEPARYTAHQIPDIIVNGQKVWRELSTEIDLHKWYSENKLESLDKVISWSIWDEGQKTKILGGNTTTGPGFIRSLQDRIATIPEVLKQSEQHIADKKEDVAKKKQFVAQPFERQEELKETESKLAEIEKKLEGIAEQKPGEQPPDEAPPQGDEGAVFGMGLGVPLEKAAERISQLFTGGTMELPLDGVEGPDSELLSILKKSQLAGRQIFKQFSIPFWIGEKYPGFGNRIYQGKVAEEGIWGVIDRIANREFLEKRHAIDDVTLNDWKDAKKLNSRQKNSIIYAIKTLNETSPVDHNLTDSELRQQFGLDDASLKVYSQIRAALDAGLEARKELDRYKLASGQFIPKPRDLKRFLKKRLLVQSGKFDTDEIDAIRKLMKVPSKQMTQAQIEHIWAIPAVKRMVVNGLIDEKYAEKELANYFPMTRPSSDRFGVVAAKPREQSSLFEDVPGFDEGDQSESVPVADNEPQLHFATFQTRAEALRHANELKRQGYVPAEGHDAIKVFEVKKDFPEGLAAKLTENQLYDLAEIAGVDSEDPALQNIVKELRARRGFDRHFIERQGIPGFQWNWENIEKNVTEHTDSSLRKYAKNVSADMAQKKLDAIRDKVPKHVYAYAQGYLDNLQATTPIEWGLLRQGIYVTTLGGSISNMIQNLTQPFTTTYNEIPILLKNSGKSTSPLLAEKIFLDGYKNTLALIAQQAGKKLGANWQNIPARWMPFIEKARNQGVVNPAQLEQLAGLTNDPRRKYASGGPLTRGVKKSWRATTDILALGQRLSEIANRNHAFLVGLQIGETYYRLKGNDLYEFAVHLVDRTQFAMGHHNIPQVAQSFRGNAPSAFIRKISKMTLILRGFSLNFAGRFGNVARSGSWGAISRNIMALLALSGLRGLPFIGILYALYNWLFVDDGGETIEMKERKQLGQLEKQWGLPGRTLTTGLPAFIGAETSRMLGAGDILPTKFDATAVLGVGASLSERGKYALDALKRGEIRQGIEQLPGVPRIVSSMERAKRISEEGIIKSGHVALRKEELTNTDKILLNLGFTPTKVADAYESSKAQATVGIAGRLMYARSIDSYVRAMERGDKDKMKGVIDNLIKHNSTASLENQVNLKQFLRDAVIRDADINRNPKTLMRREELKNIY